MKEMTLCLETLVDNILEITWEASSRILEFYDHTENQVTLKSDHSPLTAADIASHELIVKRLSQLTPHIPIISEEDVLREENDEYTLFWLVDPLDGTKEFIAKSGEFTVNIALVKDNQPILGVIGIPVLNVCYAGIVGEGAFKIERGLSKIPIRVNSSEGGEGVVVGSRSHGDKIVMEEFLSTRLPASSYKFVAAGSSLKFCKIAEGDAHLYPRFGRTMEWDTAAGQAILVAAGGYVTTVDGKALSYGKPNFENSHFIASAFKIEMLGHD